MKIRTDFVTNSSKLYETIKNMKYGIYDKNYNFNYYFNTETGFYMRTGILDENGKDTNVDPFMASFPHLIDVGVMGHCIHGESGLCKKAGVQCYQSGYYIKKPNMTDGDFEKIAKECKGLTNQLALGGRGDPNQHEDFERLLQICKENNLVPNYTTSGFDMTDKQVEFTKQYCGAVAVSWYRSDYTVDAIKRFIKAGCKTNIHYVVSNDTIAESVERLSGKGFVEGVNAVIFLMHKPVGQGEVEKIVQSDNPYLKDFCRLINQQNQPFKLGFDSCAVPMLINHCPNINRMALDTCEGGRYSCYISSDMVISPCSFDRVEKYGVSLRNKTIREAWNSPQFDEFRGSLKHSCPTCTDREFCMGGCPLVPEIVVCQSKQKQLLNQKY